MVKAGIEIRTVQQPTTAAASTCIIKPDRGPRYHSLHIVLVDGTAATVAAMLALISELRVKVNNDPVRTVTGAELEDLLALNGATYGALLSGTKTVTLNIPFAEAWRKDWKDQDALAWHTGQFGQFSVEIDFTASNNAMAVRAFAVVDNFPTPSAAQPICQWKRQPFTISGAEVVCSISGLKDHLTQASFYADSGGSLAAVSIELQVGTTKLREVIRTANLGLLKSYGMDPLGASRTGGASSKITDIVLDHDDLLGSALDLRGIEQVNFVIKTATAMSGSLVGVFQRIGLPPGV